MCVLSKWLLSPVSSSMTEYYSGSESLNSEILSSNHNLLYFNKAHCFEKKMKVLTITKKKVETQNDILHRRDIL